MVDIPPNMTGLLMSGLQYLVATQTMQSKCPGYITEQDKYIVEKVADGILALAKTVLGSNNRDLYCSVLKEQYNITPCTVLANLKVQEYNATFLNLWGTVGR